MRHPMSRLRVRSAAKCLVLTLLLPILLFCCTAPVTSGGDPVTNDTLATAARAVHIAEVAVSAVADGLTAGYARGVIPPSVLQHFQSTLAPRIGAALATAKVALKTATAAPGSTPMILVLTAVLELQQETASLQGWYTSNALIMQKGATP